MYNEKELREMNTSIVNELNTLADRPHCCKIYYKDMSSDMFVTRTDSIFYLTNDFESAVDFGVCSISIIGILLKYLQTTLKAEITPEVVF